MIDYLILLSKCNYLRKPEIRKTFKEGGLKIIFELVTSAPLHTHNVLFPKGDSISIALLRLIQLVLKLGDQDWVESLRSILLINASS